MEQILIGTQDSLVNILNLDVDDIKFGDIMNSLQKQCRFNGRTRIHYSVLKHSLLGAMIMHESSTAEEVLAFMIHDFAESFTGDIIAPIKKMFLGLYEIERKIMQTVCQLYGISEEVLYSDKIKKIDKFMCDLEGNRLVSNIVFPSDKKIMNMAEDLHQQGYISTYGFNAIDEIMCMGFSEENADRTKTAFRNLFLSQKNRQEQGDSFPLFGIAFGDNPSQDDDMIDGDYDGDDEEEGIF